MVGALDTAAGGPQNIDAPACSEVLRSSKRVGRAEGHTASLVCIPLPSPLHHFRLYMEHTMLGCLLVVALAWLLVRTGFIPHLGAQRWSFFIELVRLKLVR